jgi:hypothetical protein
VKYGFQNEPKGKKGMYKEKGESSDQSGTSTEHHEYKEKGKYSKGSKAEGTIK